ncbi:MAG: hypothetical protein ACJAYF_000955 [Arenicella sp.]|jgi:hypothetical protein
MSVQPNSIVDELQLRSEIKEPEKSAQGRSWLAFSEVAIDVNDYYTLLPEKIRVTGCNTLPIDSDLYLTSTFCKRLI